MQNLSAQKLPWPCQLDPGRGWQRGGRWQSWGDLGVPRGPCWVCRGPSRCLARLCLPRAVPESVSHLAAAGDLADQSPALPLVMTKADSKAPAKLELLLPESCEIFQVLSVEIQPFPGFLLPLSLPLATPILPPLLAPEICSAADPIEFMVIKCY